jgi:hypothetical protein
MRPAPPPQGTTRPREPTSRARHRREAAATPRQPAAAGPPPGLSRSGRPAFQVTARPGRAPRLMEMATNSSAAEAPAPARNRFPSRRWSRHASAPAPNAGEALGARDAVAGRLTERVTSARLKLLGCCRAVGGHGGSAADRHCVDSTAPARPAAGVSPAPPHLGHGGAGMLVSCSAIALGVAACLAIRCSAGCALIIHFHPDDPSKSNLGLQASWFRACTAVGWSAGN